MDNMLTVTFEPDGRTVHVLPGTRAIEAAGLAGIPLNTPCGGQGTCGKCKVELLNHRPEPTEAELNLLTADELRRGMRLACQLRIHHDATISVPDQTRFFEQTILTEGTRGAFNLEPNLTKHPVMVPPASAGDPRSCLDRLIEALGKNGKDLQVDLTLARTLSTLAAENAFQATVVMRDDRIYRLEPGDPTDRLWGIAFDIGTTTIVGTLLDLNTGRPQGVASRTNPQVSFGDDVVSRINYAQQHPDGLNRMRQRLLNCMEEMIAELLQNAAIKPEWVYEITAVGNTTMNHIFLGLDPTSIGRAPYVAVLRGAMDVEGSDMGLNACPNASLYTLPNIAGFVGSDTVGVVLATGMMFARDLQLAIDIGTNGEVVLGNRDRLVACSCAAGPAFEGARIRHGMRATEGAISKVVINEGIEVEVIGGGPPRGICGSALVDVVAELLRLGLIDQSGRMAQADQAPKDVPEEVREALTEVDGQPAVTLADATHSGTGEPVVLTQRDVREVQLAKAAIRAGIEVICRHCEVDPLEVSRILLAGGFGNFIRRSNAIRIGLLPPVPTSRVEFVGNAASEGAKMALLSRSCRRNAELISRNTEYVELANRPDFQNLFAEHLMFPRQQ